MKTRTDMDARILAIAEPVAEDLGLDIVRIRVQGNKRTTVQIMAERKSDGLMEITDCEELSRALSAVLDVNDPLKEAYALEVSSPGIDRPLTALNQFARYEGFDAKIELDRMVEGRKRFKGVLAGVEDGAVGLDMEREEDTVFIPFEWIAEARLVMSDKLMERGRAEFEEKKQKSAQADKS